MRGNDGLIKLQLKQRYQHLAKKFIQLKPKYDPFRNCQRLYRPRIYPATFLIFFMQIIRHAVFWRYFHHIHLTIHTIFFNRFFTFFANSHLRLGFLRLTIGNFWRRRHVF